MFILFLVELLKVGGVIVFTVRSHLLSHLSLLSGLRVGKKHNTNTDHKRIVASVLPIRHRHFKRGFTHTESVGHGIKTYVLTHLCAHACTCRHINAEHVQTRSHRCSTVPGTGHSLLLEVGQSRHIKKTHGGLRRLSETARPSWSVLSIPKADRFMIVQPQRVKADSHRHSRSSLLRIQDKQMEMRLSQLGSIGRVCVRVCLAEHSYYSLSLSLSPLSFYQFTCDDMGTWSHLTVVAKECLTVSHLVFTTSRYFRHMWVTDTWQAP